MPVWFLVVIAVCAVAAIAIAAYAVEQSRGWARLPMAKLYNARPKDVSVAAVKVIDGLGYAISHRDEQAVSFTSGYLGEGAGVAPVVHVVILPTEGDQTRLEVVGSRGPNHYLWHAMAQAFLTDLDREMREKAS